MISALLLGFMLKKRWQKKLFLSLAVILFLFFTNPWIYSEISYLRLKSFPQNTMEPGKKYQVAIVMGGFSSYDMSTGSLSFIEDRAGRLWDAVKLYKEGKVGKLLITGDPSIQTNDDGYDTSRMFLKYMEIMGIPANDIILERNAVNTRQNAEFSVEVIKATGVSGSDCVIVTDASHMDRTLGCFLEFGFRPAYYAVNLPLRPAGFSHRSLYPRWSTAVEWESLFNESIGNVVYSIAGYR